MPTAPTIDVQISNFLKIENAQFQVKPFTLIAGKNASGKSSITRLMYCILQTLNGDQVSESLSIIYEAIGECSDYLEFLLDDLSNNELKSISLQLKALRSELPVLNDGQLGVNVQLKQFFVINERLSKITKKLSRLSILDSIDGNQAVKPILDVLIIYSKQLHLLIDDPIKSSHSHAIASLNKFILQVFQVNNISRLGNNAVEQSQHLENGHFLLSFNSRSIQFNSQDNIQLPKNLDDFKFYQQFDNIVYLESPVYLKLKGAISQLIEYDSRPDLNSSIKRQEQKLKKVPQYILDTFEMLKSDIIVEQVDPIIAEVKQDIAKLLGGQLQVSDGGDIQFMSQNGNGQGISVDINHTASGTTALGTIALLLDKNIVVPNSVLIFDEPEVNLHPAWQHAMIQILYKLSLAGVTIIMATHSYDMLNATEKCMDDFDDKSDDVEGHFSIIQLDDGNTINEKKPVFKKLDAVKADLSQPIFDLLTGGQSSKGSK